VIVADSSVWIDFFRDADTPEVARLDWLLDRKKLLIGDLMLVEILQGIDSNREFERIRREMDELDCIEIGGKAIAVEAARNFRRLRGLGITIRKTIDTLIATRCIVDDHQLLYSDRDFEPFVTHLGLRSAMAEV
jgi:predicted nucleic acid-binding protein